MKYIAKKNAIGKWAVFQGKRCFLGTMTDNELVARQTTLVMSMEWYNEQKEIAWEELKKISEVDESGEKVRLVDYEDFSKMSDFLY